MIDYEVLLRYLKDIRDKESDGWILAGNVHSVDTPYGWIGFRGDRNCRDLAEVGIIEKDDEGKFVKVRFLYPNEILENVKKLNPLTSPKERKQLKWFKLVKAITITREEYERALANGIQI